MRHRVKTRKLHRDIDARQALVFALTKNMFESDNVKTSTAKAKYIRSNVEKLITIAKKDKDALAKRRLLLSKLRNKKELVDLVMKKAASYPDLNSGYLRIQKLANQKGDNSQVSKLTWVEAIQIKNEKLKVENEEKETIKTVKKAVTKKAVEKKEEKKTVKKSVKKATKKAE